MGNRLAELLAKRDYLLADGATGTNMMAMGLPPGQAPDLWNLQAPEKVSDLHARFIEAGALPELGVIYNHMGDAVVARKPQSGSLGAIGDHQRRHTSLHLRTRVRCVPMIQDGLEVAPATADEDGEALAVHRGTTSPMT